MKKLKYSFYSIVEIFGEYATEDEKMEVIKYCIDTLEFPNSIRKLKKLIDDIYDLEFKNVS